MIAAVTYSMPVNARFLEAPSPGNALGKSARGLAHSRTLARYLERFASRSVLDCGSPLPLLFNVYTANRDVMGRLH